MKTTLSVALVLLASPFAVVCQDTGTPVPSEWIHEGRLVVPQFNFSIGSPNPDSRWSYLDLPSIQGFKTTGFVVGSPTNGRFLVIVWESGSNASLDDPANRNSFLEHMRNGLPKGWSAVGEPEIEPTDVPIKGSSKVKTTIRLPADGGLVHAYVYVVSGKRTSLTVLSSDAPPWSMSKVSSILLMVGLGLALWAPLLCFL